MNIALWWQFLKFKCLECKAVNRNLESCDGDKLHQHCVKIKYPRLVDQTDARRARVTWTGWNICPSVYHHHYLAINTTNNNFITVIRQHSAIVSNKCTLLWKGTALSAYCVPCWQLAPMSQNGVASVHILPYFFVRLRSVCNHFFDIIFHTFSWINIAKECNLFESGYFTNYTSLYHWNQGNPFGM